MKDVLIIPTSEPVSVKENTRFILNLQGKESSTLHLLFETEGVEAEIIALYKLAEKQKLELTTIAQHKVPHTKCMTSARGVLLDSSSSTYVGKIIIDKPAQQTVSYLDDKVLTIGKTSKNTSQPILQIEADDVKASHGATTGGVDLEQIYYLQSRGLSHDEAQNLIITGFFEELISQIENAEIKNRVLESIMS